MFIAKIKTAFDAIIIYKSIIIANNISYEIVIRNNNDSNNSSDIITLIAIIAVIMTATSRNNESNINKL